MKVITNPADVDLARHAVIEASAGTGKTYTITHLVLRLITEQRIPITQILLVTFTDKATSELKERIHKGINDQLTRAETSDTDRLLLAQSLRDLHLASIHTIHGFCQRVLKEYAFEQGSVLDKTLVDDNSIYLKQLQALKRTWPAIDGIEDKLKKTGKSMQQLDELLIELAKQSKAGDLIYPDSPAEALLAAQKALSEYEQPDVVEMKQIFHAMDGFSTTVKNNRWKKYVAVIETLEPHLVDSSLLSSINNDLEKLSKNFSGVFSDVELKKLINANQDDDISLFLKSHDQIKNLLSTYRLAHQADKYQFIIEMVETLREQVKQHKVSQGQISYDDMITDLAAALTTEKSSDDPPLTQRLRAKYQVALIDEFQDTDAQQWSIFQWLFTANSEAHRLVLIGDPKQSIYGFRGANIHTYESAKDYLLDKTRVGLGYRLATNFRSLPDLTEQLNQFFTYQSNDHPLWYADKEVKVAAPTLAQRREIGGPLLLEDTSGLAAMNSITVSGSGLLVNGFKQKMAVQIARLIQQKLLGKVRFQRKGTEKVLDAGDVCVLVRNKNDAKPIEQALDQLKIPHSFYKKTDLYQSEAAIQIQLVLTALAFPNMKRHMNNAWLGLFFGLTAAQLKQLKQQQGVINDDDALSQALAWWLKLKSLSAQQDWIGVFTTLFEETGTAERLYAKGQWRMLANLQQLKQDLVKASLEQKLEAHGLLHHLLSSRSSQLISKEDWQQKDTELPSVQIMTIHSSKGLEYPVVFLFGGYSAPGKNHPFCKYHDPAIPAQVFDLADSNAPLFQEESEAENKRLYYVAMTRAVFKLFVPVYEAETYQARNKPYVFYQAEVVDRLLTSGFATLASELTDVSHSGFFNATPQKQLSVPPIPQLPAAVTDRSRIIHSFSSLQRHHPEGSTQFGEINQVDPVQADDVNSELSTLIQNNPSIPGGAQTGNVLHGIFENIDFSLVMKHESLNEFKEDQSVREIIESQMKAFLMTDGELLDEDGKARSSYSEEFASWVYHTLNLPIEALGGQRLCEIGTGDRRHEMSFFWSQGGHVLTGFIDLLFRVSRPEGDEYFILDWKSNFSPGGYTPDVLATEVMQAHNYHDQYRWYALAIKAWFNSLQLKNAKLSGALYLFSRGIDSHSSDQNGVFYQDLSTDAFNLEHLEQQLMSEIKATSQSTMSAQKGQS
ncbi:UvrD-helicase domain-containing protein [Marinicella sp. S1101]|uniref:UvrD-helicase domain-containing protein n=1 Tax=Marinicella marina TaxID=2996016 RepID=UPI0022608B05|nr:UvrD-helicase domain-containing protein [Marinicella marina]MCX7553488.1 UvrD-helicase domain-containing protein [Marinicella marina]MDJ1140112.1 UvrD-helicase domain-containing protein [Marinicella marina]